MTDEKRELIEPELRKIIQIYNEKIEEMYDETNPGQIRSKKGDLVENIAVSLVNIAWEHYLEQPKDKIEPKRRDKRIKLGIKNFDEYLTRYKQAVTIDKIKEHKESIYYNFETDVHVYINKNLVLAIECKSYTENAMFKRIIYDRNMLHEEYPNAKYVLLQLESALGGDFDSCSNSQYGSNQYHFFMSREDKNIEIITLLEKPRDAKKPIHKRGNKKDLEMKHLLHAVEFLAEILKEYI